MNLRSVLASPSFQQFDQCHVFLGELIELFDQDGCVDQVRKERLEVSVL